jgi:putative ABC transport system permease protein
VAGVLRSPGTRDEGRMTWFAMALRNCGRRRPRTALTVAGVAVAVAALFSVLAFQRGYTRGMAGELDRLGAHVLVVPKGCPYDAASIALHGARWPCYLKTEYLREVEALSTVAEAAPVFMSAVDDPSGTQYVYSGVTREILALKKGWHLRGRFPERPGDLLVGSEVAARRKWQAGDSVALPGVASERGQVAGVLQPTGGADDTFIYMPLPDAQRIFKRRDELTHILVRLRDTDQLDEAIGQMRSCGSAGEMNVIPMTHLFRTIQSLVNSTRLLLGSVVLVALLIAAAGVSNTMFMAVLERTQEIGTLRALGASTGDIFRLFWLETVQVCGAGGVLGILIAFGGAQAIEAWLRARLPFAPTEPLIRWEWWVAAACLGAVLLLGTLAGLLPSWRAARMAPIEAIRAEGAGM